MDSSAAAIDAFEDDPFFRTQAPHLTAPDFLDRFIEMFDDMNRSNRICAFGACARTRLAYGAHISMQTTCSVWQRRRPISSVKNCLHRLFGAILSDP